MIVQEEVAVKTAELLLQIKAIKLNPSNPYTWASGWRSPIYCDNRKILSYPKVRTFIRQQLAAAIESKTGKPDVIAGVATGAIAHGVLAAQALDLPFIYVRPKPKEHGLGNQIEGEVEAGKRAVVVEDLVSTGMSSLQALQALRSAGVEVKGMVAIFDYGFQVAKKAFNEAKCDLFTLSDYPTLIRVAMETNYIKEADLKALTAWRNHPDTWQQPKS